MGGASVPTLSAPIAAIRDKSVGAEAPPTKAQAPSRQEPPRPPCPLRPTARPPSAIIAR
ncbi:DUF6053 domain-containing protein [Lysobacter enzymogenes]|uniref:DUF6053 domain-containing protein n=1 Tax=Lysobacter enzymogenes TaxID=69 RepID=UPI003D1884F6